MRHPNDRTGRSAINGVIGLLTQVVLIGLSFLTRWIFVLQLGAEFVGIHALLVSVVAVLAIADLGVNAAFMHALYGPLSEGDNRRTSAIVQYAGRIYGRIAVAVVVAGILSLGVVGRLVTVEHDVALLRVYLAILVADAVANYLVANRAVLLEADQRLYVVNLATLGFAVGRSIAQVAALFVLESFIVFLAIQVLSTLARSLYLRRAVARTYPYLSKQPELSRSDRREVAKSVRAVMVYRLGGVVLSNSDPILISIIVGTLALGYFANYMLIVGSVAMLVEALFRALSPSVGNLVAAGDSARSLGVLDELTLLATATHGAMAVALIACLNEFIFFWLGSQYVLEFGVTIALALNFYLAGSLWPVWAFRGATGMFRETQFVFLFTASLNIALSIALGVQFGIFGILLATAISRLATGVWYEPWILFTRHLHSGSREYARRQISAFLLWGALGSMAVLVSRGLTGIPQVAATTVLLLSLPFVVWVVYGRTDALRALRGRAVRLGAGAARDASSQASSGR